MVNGKISCWQSLLSYLSILSVSLPSILQHVSICFLRMRHWIRPLHHDTRMRHVWQEKVRLEDLVTCLEHNQVTILSFVYIKSVYHKGRGYHRQVPSPSPELWSQVLCGLGCVPPPPPRDRLRSGRYESSGFPQEDFLVGSWNWFGSRTLMTHKVNFDSINLIVIVKKYRFHFWS